MVCLQPRMHTRPARRWPAHRSALAPRQPGRGERAQVARCDVERVEQRAECRQCVLVGERRLRCVHVAQEAAVYERRELTCAAAVGARSATELVELALLFRGQGRRRGVACLDGVQMVVTSAWSAQQAASRRRRLIESYDIM